MFVNSLLAMASVMRVRKGKRLGKPTLILGNTVLCSASGGTEQVTRVEGRFGGRSRRTSILILFSPGLFAVCSLALR